MRRLTRLGFHAFAVCSLVSASGVACSPGTDKEGGQLAAPDAGTNDSGGITLDDGGLLADANLDGGGGLVGEPKTCAEAAAAKAYVGCDFWPTVVANNVWRIFDFAVVVANAGDEEAEVEVTGTGVSQKVKVPARSLEKIYLPWNTALKGPDGDECGAAAAVTSTVRANKGAYHLVSSRPVTVYQFNALQYKGAGGPPGKSWSSCPGNQVCWQSFTSIGCFSFSNDASLLLPSTAMTGNYRVMGIHGWTSTTGVNVMGAYFAVTATQDDTKVKVTVGPNGRVLAGGGIPSTNAGGVIDVTMNAGDVIQFVGEAKTTSDLSGSLVQADKPVQVISGIPCIQNPIGVQACDHIEESVFPAETLGKDYFVTVPTGPNGNVVGHGVRIYGNRDGTKLTYAPSKPAGAPDTINAGQTVTLTEVKADFRVTGDQEFAVGSFMLGGARLDPSAGVGNEKGDPSMSFATAIEQYRKKYIFLAPDDYQVSYVDIVYPDGTTMTLDGAAPPAGTPIGSTGYNIARVKLGPGEGGAHRLEASKPVGIQVMGYGAYTSYQYPGGLDLKSIAPPPVK